MKKITKEKVESIIWSGLYHCEYRMGNDMSNQDYDGCEHNLVMILWDDETKVSVAKPTSLDYKEGYQTIVMDAPCMDAVILIRTAE